MSDIDNLQIKIKGESKSAIKEIDNTIANLEKLSAGLQVFSEKTSSFSSNFKGVTLAFKNIADSVNTVSTDKLKDFTNALNGVSRAVNKINDTVNKLDFSHISSEMKLVQKISKEGTKFLSEAFNIKGTGTQKELSQNLEKWIASVEEAGKLTKETEQYKAAVEAAKQAQKEVGDTIKENAKIIDDSKGIYSDLIDYMQSMNKSGKKVFLPFSPSEFKDDYSSMRATLGKAFTSDKAFRGSGDITEFVKELNSQLGNIIPVADNEADTFSNLVRVMKEARDTTLSYDEAVKKGIISGKDLSEHLNTIISKYAKEKEALESTGQSLGKEGNNFTLFAEQLKKIEDIKVPDTEKFETFAKSVRKLGYKSVDKAIQNMPKLAEGLKGVMETLSKAPDVSQSVIQMTNAIANLASQGGKVGAANKYLVTSMGKVGNSNKILSGKFEGLSKSMNRAKHHTHSLARAFGKFYANYFLLVRGTKQLGKSIKSAMDYIETLNYFEASFGKVAESAKDNFKEAGYESAEVYAKSFEKRAKALTEKMSGFKITDNGELIPDMRKSLGMNPEKLMQYQAVFAQMSDSMGVTAETSLKLSNALTEIGADLASVRNMDFDEVWKDMQSGLVGMSRTLDKYGVNIRDVNMQEKLEQLGIKANIKALNQNNKALLRTIILLDSSRFAWGDLAKTIQSPANQLRLLKENFASLARTIGQVFIPVLGKILPVINSVIAGLQKLVYAIGKIFGLHFGGSGGGSKAVTFGLDEDTESAVMLNEELDDSNKAVMLMDDELGNVNSDLKDASKNAKKLNDHLLGIDELNVVRPDEEEKAGGGGGGGAGGDFDIGEDVTGVLEGALDDLLKEYQKAWDEAFDNMEARANEFVDNLLKAFQRGGLEGAGDFISKSLENALRNIDWDKIYQGAANFGKGLADFLNGLIRPELFEAVGETIAKALNTAIEAAFSFGKTFNFKNLGESIAAGINGFFRTFNFGLLADTINTWVLGILDTMITAIKKTDWGLIGRKIGEFLSKIQFTKIGLKIGKLIWEAIVAGIKFWISSFNVAPIETLIITALGFHKFKSSKLYQELLAIGEIVKDTVRAIAGDTVALGALSENFPKFARAVEVARVAFLNFRIGMINSDFATGINMALQTIRENLTGFQKGIISVVTSATEFVVVKNAFADIASGTEHLALKIAEIGTAVGAAGAIMYTTFGPAGAVIAGLTALAGAFAGVDSAMKEMVENSVFETLETKGTVSFETLANVATTTFDTIINKSEETREKLDTIGETRESINGTTENLGYLQTAIENGAYTVSEKIPEIIEQFNTLLSDSQTIFNEEYDVILKGLLSAPEEALEALNVSLPELLEKLTTFKDGGSEALAEIDTSFKTLIKQFEDGSITEQEFLEQFAPLAQKMQEFANSDAKSATDEMEKFKGSLDMSAYMEDGRLSLEKFSEEFGNVTSNAKDAKDGIIEMTDGGIQALNDFVEKGKALGQDGSVIDVEGIIGVDEASRDKALSSIETTYNSLANQIQYDLLEQIPQVVDDATKNYENLHWWQTLFTTKAEYVSSAIETWKGNVLTPASDTIQKGFEDLGIEGEPWAAAAANTIIGSLFDNTVIATENGAPNVQSQLKENYRSILDGALSGASEAVDAENYGKNTVDGFNKGVSDNSNLTNDTILQWIKNGIDKVATALDSHSPSRVMADYGKFAVEGFNQGIEENKETTRGFLDSWLKDIIDSFSNSKENVKNTWGDVSSWFSENVLSPIKSFFQETWDSVKTYASEAWDNIQSIWGTVCEWFNSTIIEPLKQYFQEAWENIKQFFSDAWTNIQETWGVVCDWFNETIIEPLKTFFQEAWETIKGFFSEAWENIKEVWSTVCEWFNSTIIEPLKKFFQDAWEKIKKFFSDAWKEIQKVWGKVSNWFKENVSDPVTKKFTSLKDSITKAFKDAWEEVKAIWGKAAAWFNEHVVSPIKSAWNAVKSVFSGGGGGGKSTSTYSLDDTEPYAVQTFDNGEESESGATGRVGRVVSTFSELPDIGSAEALNKSLQASDDTIKKMQEEWTEMTNWFGDNVAKPLKALFYGTWETIKAYSSEAVESVESVWETFNDWITTNVTEQLSTSFQSIWSGAEGAASEARDSIQEVWETVPDWFNSTVIEPLEKSFDDASSHIKEAFMKVWEEVKGEIGNAISEMVSQNIIEPLKKFFEDIWKDIESYAQEALENVQESWSDILAWFNEVVTEPLKLSFEETWNNVKENSDETLAYIQEVWGVVSEWFIENVTEPLKTSFSEAFYEIKDIFLTEWANTQEEIWTIISMLLNQKIVEPFTKLFQEALKKIKLSFISTWTEVQAVWEVVPAWFEENVLKFLKADFKELKESIISEFSSAWEGVKEVWSEAPSWFETNVIGPIEEAFASMNISIGTGGASETSGGGGGASPMSIQGYAVGGRPNRADLFWANEYGVPELIGTMGGRAAVASGTEITGIKEAVYQSGDEQAKLLQTAVQLLQIISDKDTTLEIDGRELVSAYNSRSRRNGFSFT